MISQRIEGEPPYYSNGGVLRLSPRGIFVYDSSENKRSSSNSSPFFNYHLEERLQKDKDGIMLIDKNPAEKKLKEWSVELSKGGRLMTPEGWWPGELFTDFIERYTPSSLVGHWGPKYDPSFGGFPRCDRWSKLPKSEKEQVIERVIDKIRKAFLENPEEYFHSRLRVKESLISETPDWIESLIPRVRSKNLEKRLGKLKKWRILVHNVTPDEEIVKRKVEEDLGEEVDVEKFEIEDVVNYGEPALSCGGGMLPQRETVLMVYYYPLTSKD